MQVDIKLSKHYANATQAQFKNCWGNSFTVVNALPDALYVEGWAVNRSGMIFEHGWVQYNGRIIDTMLWLDEGLRYFSALCFTFQAAKRAAARKTKTMKKGELPIVWRYGSGGGNHPDYMKAYQHASAYSQSMCLAYTPDG